MALADTLQNIQESLQDFDFNNLDFQNIGSWPVVVKVFVWIIAFGGCVAGGYKFDVEDLYKSLAKVEKEEVELKKEYQSKAFQAANLDAYRKQMEEMKLSFGALVGQLPSDTEVPGLLEDITNKGVGNGLDFKSINLKPEHKAEFYAELPIEIIVDGTYHDMGAFVSGVAGLPRIVTLHDFTIKPARDSSLQMAITAKTYRYAEDDEAKSDGKNNRKSRRKGGKK